MTEPERFPEGPYEGRTLAERDAEVARAMEFLTSTGYRITFPSLRNIDRLKSIDNALRNGSFMTKANLAFDELCEELGVQRESLISGEGR